MAAHPDSIRSYRITWHAYGDIVPDNTAQHAYTDTMEAATLLVVCLRDSGQATNVELFAWSRTPGHYVSVVC